jgi:hypothetical protein
MKFKYKLLFTLLPILFLVMGECKLFKNYDIEGDWVILKVVNGVETEISATFTEYSGYRDTGQVFVDDNTYGIYEVNFDSDLVFEIYYFPEGGNETGRKDTFTGGFDSGSTMSGTVTEIDTTAGTEVEGTWTAAKLEPTL